jgi:hypothetical protein
VKDWKDMKDGKQNIIPKVSHQNFRSNDLIQPFQLLTNSIKPSRIGCYESQLAPRSKDMIGWTIGRNGILKQPAIDFYAGRVSSLPKIVKDHTQILQFEEECTSLLIYDEEPEQDHPYESEKAEDS